MEQIIDDFKQLNFNESQKLADKNEPDGIYWLGYCYEFGIGVEKDEKKAFINYQKSADLNNYNAIYKVGYCYYLGIGIEVDKKKAFENYMKSANAGNLIGFWKTAICYYYGIGVEENYDKFVEWYHSFSVLAYINRVYDRYIDVHNNTYGRRESKYGKCAYCNEDNTQPAWCLSCDPDITTRWTSKNIAIDDCIKAFQIRTLAYDDAIEWISYDKLVNIIKIGEGGFGSIYKATWLEGIRKICGNDFNYVRSYEESSTVALKTLSCSLKEFYDHVTCGLFGSKLKIYGLTLNTETNEYFMVFQYADSGSLHKFLRKNFHNLSWQTKLKLLIDISKDLYQIHRAGYIHTDLHSGNILQDESISKNMQSYISDLGLSKKEVENDSKSEIFGVMPYVAPEVLLGQKFTKAADIYGFGVIMSEMSTGQRPFDGHDFDIKLAIKICKGLRPEFAPGSPDFYIELASQCMNADPEKRPDAKTVFNKLEEWDKCIESSDDANKIKRQFLDADKIAKEMPIISPKHFDDIYTTKLSAHKKYQIQLLKPKYQMQLLKSKIRCNIKSNQKYPLTMVAKFFRVLQLKAQYN